MKIDELIPFKNQGVKSIPTIERRRFLCFGLKVTGVFLSGALLSLTSIQKARGSFQGVGVIGTFSYKPHYSMVVLQDKCIGCGKCVDACKQTNDVPQYGYRLAVLKRPEQSISLSDRKSEFLPVLCNQCNRPPCVRVCPTKATYKDKKTGIVMMKDKLCIGCKACIAACPYDSRYYKEENRAIDKCDFCHKTRLSQGKKTTACEEVCPTNALVFGDLVDKESSIYKLVHSPNTTVWVLRPALGTMPNLFYIKD